MFYIFLLFSPYFCVAFPTCQISSQPSLATYVGKVIRHLLDFLALNRSPCWAHSDTAVLAGAGAVKTAAAAAVAAVIIVVFAMLPNLGNVRVHM